ncbi:hypothetical protein M4951_11730 [Blastopirellula sp. J2-11]|uniref:hypothetical protein n=1 Tax=Blastopirellula sp. J2-11 TaxID=2943192 RepID=UPI0021CA7F1C|nr:hypothetical protein [Blastopirellula sp. J2-11]UUO08962.1 hypothetical protein M4951_11730 [Blastopirellula sp. J2-11]
MSSYWKIRLLCAVLVAVALVGCHATKPLRRDQDDFRQALLEMETNQIFNNLVRAKRGLPIIHVDYDRISGVVTQTGNAQIGGSYTDIVGGAVTRVLSPSVSGKQDNQLGVTGNPVRDKPEVYVSYLQYLALGDGLVFTTFAPPPGSAHLCTETCDGFYWVPTHRTGDFFKLSMDVMGLRGKLLASPPYFEITLKGVSKVEPGVRVLMQNEKLPLGTQHEMIVELSEPLARNDSGTAAVSIDGFIVPVLFSAAPGIAIGEKTSKLKIDYTYGNDMDSGEIPITPQKFIDGLRGQTVKFYASRFQPEPPKQDVLLGQIRDELNALRFETIRQGNDQGR